MEFKDFSRLCEPWKINKTDSFKYAGRTPLRTECDCLELRFTGYLTGDVHGSLGVSGLLVLGSEVASGSEVAKGMEIAMGAASVPHWPLYLLLIPLAYSNMVLVSSDD